jgi:hypothetical protein
MPALGTRSWLIKMSAAWLAQQRYEKALDFAEAAPDNKFEKYLFAAVVFMKSDDIARRLKSTPLDDLRRMAGYAEKEFGLRKAGRHRKSLAADDVEILLAVRNRKNKKLPIARVCNRLAAKHGVTQPVMEKRYRDAKRRFVRVFREMLDQPRPKRLFGIRQGDLPSQFWSQNRQRR